MDCRPIAVQAQGGCARYVGMVWLEGNILLNVSSPEIVRDFAGVSRLA